MHRILLLTATLLGAIALTAQTDQFFFQKLDCQSATTMCFDADSNLWIGATRDNQPLFLKVSRKGILLDQLQLDIPYGSWNVPTGLLVDSEGMLVGCGTMSPAISWQRESSFVFRYDPVARELLWSRHLYNDFLFLRGISERFPGGPYFVFGMDEGIPALEHLLMLDRNTGEALPDFNFTYHFGPNENLGAAVYHQGAYYAVGMNDLRTFNGMDPGPYLQQGLWRFDSTGAPVWSVNGSVPVSQRSKLRGRDLIVEDDAIYSLSEGDEVDLFPLSSKAKIFLQKTSLDGTPIWIRKYEIQEFDYLRLAGSQLISVADGFVILGGGLNNDFLLKTDKAGKLLWAQRVKTNGFFGSGYTQPQSNLLTDGHALYLVSNIQEGGMTFGAFVKTDLNGNIPGCDRLATLLAAELPIPNPVFTQTLLTQYPSVAISDTTETNVLATAAFATEKLCENEGATPQNPCKPTTFLRRLGSTGPSMDLETLTLMPQGYLCAAGQAGASALLTAFDASGTVLWTKTLDPAPGDSLSITDLVVDSDSLLAGFGYYTDAQGQRSPYAFRYRPDSVGTLIWSVRIESTQEHLGGGIVEKIPDGAFLIYFNTRQPDGRLAPETVELDRATGEIVPSGGHRYESAAGNQLFSAMLPLGSFGLFSVGQLDLSNGPRMALSRFSINTGSVQLAQTSHQPAVAQTASGGYASLIRDNQDNLVIAYGGATSGNMDEPDRLFLQKTRLFGLIAWVRTFELPAVSEIDLLQVPDGYVVMGKTGPASYVFLKTDLNGNLLTAKNLELGPAPAGGNGVVRRSPHRMVLLDEHLFAVLYDDRVGQGSSFLLKMDLNLELAGPCGLVQNINPATNPDFNPVATPFTEQVAFTTPSGQPAPAGVFDGDVPLDQLCPPVYVEPTLSLGPDRAICSLDKVLLMPSNLNFVSYLWQDSTTAPTFEASTAGAYVLEATTMCETVLRDTVQLSVSAHPSRADTLAAAPFFPVILAGKAYYAPDTVTFQIPSGTGFCDTLHTYYLVPCQPVSTSLSLTFYPGQTLVLDGITYDQPGVYTNMLQTQFGCDSLVTYTLEWLITSLDVICSADRSDTAALGLTSLPVFYDLPVIDTDCPEPGTGYTLLSGLPPGAPFPLGKTQVCYEIKNGCGIRDTCCFTVTVVPTAPPCDVKTPGTCLQVELLGIQLDSVGNRRYTIRLRNACAEALDYVAFQVPKGVQALHPANGAIFTAASGNTYLVRNPNASPFYSIRYMALTDQLKNGASDIFEYTLPQQATPPYIRVFARFAGGTAVETHLSALSCDPIPWAQNRSSTDAPLQLNSGFRLWPNPTNRAIYVDLSIWLGQRVQLSITNAQGQLVYSTALDVEDNIAALDLPESTSDGVYNLTVRGPDGARQTLRIIVLR